MDTKMLERIARESGVPDLPEILSERLSESDLNTLLLYVFSRKTLKKSPAELLHTYRNNRFVRPSAVDPVAFNAFALEWLQAAADAGFTPLELSPVSPLGACSVVATAHQNKVLSALRGTEVVADATNVLALESAVRRRQTDFPPDAVHFSAAHRHVRAQEVPNIPGFSAHFSILVLTSAGRDTGDFAFEKENFLRHARFYTAFFEEKLHVGPVKWRFRVLNPGGQENRPFRAVLEHVRQTEPHRAVEIVEAKQEEQEYYRHVQFKIVIPHPKGGEIEIADGGFTDWTQKLTGNRKERLLISGMGLELLYKIVNGLV